MGQRWFTWADRMFSCAMVSLSIVLAVKYIPSPMGLWERLFCTLGIALMFSGHAFSLLESVAMQREEDKEQH